MIKFKFNSGMLAILCSKCNKILKVGNEFTKEEIAAINGELNLPKQYCQKCKPIIMKKCKECKVEKQKNEFPIDRSVKEGYRSVCKKCCNKKRMDKYYEIKNNELIFF